MPRTKVEYDDFGLVKNYICPSCGNKVKLDHVDDVGTKFFKCQKCGHQSWKLKSAKLQQLETELKDLQREITLKELDEILDSTVKYDSPNKKITFLMMLLNYTESNQTNLAFNAESSTGKSYIPIELSWFFPQNDVREIAYSSPTSFFHDHGVWLKEEKQIVINLHQKILLFLDQPHDQLLQRLRPLLSHDKKELIYKITDRRQKSGLRTKNVKVIGYPSVIFCSAKPNFDAQERTRLLLLSPETSQEKIRAGILLRIEKESNRQQFSERMEQDKQRVWLQQRVELIRTRHIKNIVITEEDSKFIRDRFFKLHNRLVPRHQRDISRLIGLIKAHALLNCFTRQEGERTDDIVATRKDVDAGFGLYLEVSEANELGVPPGIYEIYKAVAPLIGENGVTRQEFAKLHFQKFFRPIGSKRLREVLRILDSCGLIQEEADPSDKRRKLIFVTELNTLQGGGNQYTAYPHAQGYLISLDDLISAHWVDEKLSIHKCGICNQLIKSSWKAKTNKGIEIWICESCKNEFEDQRTA